MEDVTDAAFRRLIIKYSKYNGRGTFDERGKFTPSHAARVSGPAVMFTEFTSADGLVLADTEGQRRLRKKLIYDESERPIVAQLFTAVPEHMEKAARLIADLGFDGIDINMGCPVDEVVRQGCGAALIKNPKLARELIQAAKKSGLPVSVKTRIGYAKDEIDTWISELLSEELAAVIIHARTRKEMSKVPAQWSAIQKAVSIRNSLDSKTLILGNGDVKDLADARTKVTETGCDGVMLGRAIYGNPWLFADANNLEQNRKVITPREKIQVLHEHLQLFDKLLSSTTNFAIMKKHFKAYISGWDGAKDLRVRLMETENSKAALDILAGAQRKGV